MGATLRAFTGAEHHAYFLQGSEQAVALLVGNSMGAALAIQAAAQRHVDGLLLFAPWWHIKQGWLDALYPFMHPLIPRLRPFRRAKFDDARFRTALLRFMPDVNLDDPVIQEAVRALEIDTSVIGEVRRAGHLVGEAALAAAAPTLIVQGARDVLVVSSVTAALVRRLPNVVGLAVVDGDHEFAHLENAGDQAIESLIAHFAVAVTTGACRGARPSAASMAQAT